MALDPTLEEQSYGLGDGMGNNGRRNARGFRVRPGDVIVNYRASDAANIQVGQFNTPFTAENRTALERLTFMERAMPTRLLGAPSERDVGAMVWGHLSNRVLYWSWAVMQGDGQGRINADQSDNSGGPKMTAARIYTRPFASGSSGFMPGLTQLGLSFKYASHNKDSVFYDHPAMTTQSGYRYWVPRYSGWGGSGLGGAGRVVHVIPSGAQLGVAGELRFPLERFDLRSEVVYVSNGTREAVGEYQQDYTERLGKVRGFGYHVTMSYWLLGEPFFTGIAGDMGLTRLQLDRPDSGISTYGLELALRWEQLGLDYSGASRGGTSDPWNIDGSIRHYAMSAAANLWASRHIRAGVSYVLNVLPDVGDSLARPGLDSGNRMGAGSTAVLHELGIRVGVGF
ncbi:MAG: porin [Polyangiaceae bacterium]|nr:porin [Polyangiaceae bacterium]